MADRARPRDRVTSPFVLLRTQAGRRPHTPALNLPGSPPRELTWGQLFREVEDLAAGLLASGVRAGHVALLLTAPGHRSVLVELSLRAIGAVPVRLGPGAGVPEATAPLTQSPVSLVVVDGPEQVDTLEGLPLDRASLLDLSDAGNYSGLVEVGRARLQQQPDAVAHADHVVDAIATIPRIVTARGEVVAALGEVGRTSLITARDRVLLVGDPHDTLVMQVRDASLVTGAALAWITDVDEVADTIRSVQPTVLALGRESATAFEQVVLDARVDGRHWHTSPAAVLDAVAAVALGGTTRIPRGARRRAAAVNALRPWFGADLTQVLTTSETSPRLRASLDALEIDVDVEGGPVLAPANLPQPPARRIRPRTPLPQRLPAPVDQDFVPITVREVEPDPPDNDVVISSPHLRPLLTGESFLDRVLAEQAASANPLLSPSI